MWRVRLSFVLVWYGVTDQVDYQWVPHRWRGECVASSSKRERATQAYCIRYSAEVSYMSPVMNNAECNTSRFKDAKRHHSIQLNFFLKWGWSGCWLCKDFLLQDEKQDNFWKKKTNFPFNLVKKIKKNMRNKPGTIKEELISGAIWSQLLIFRLISEYKAKIQPIGNLQQFNQTKKHL